MLQARAISTRWCMMKRKRIIILSKLEVQNFLLKKGSQNEEIFSVKASHDGKIMYVDGNGDLQITQNSDQPDGKPIVKTHKSNVKDRPKKAFGKMLKLN